MIKVWDYLKEYEYLREEILEAVDQVFKDGTLIFGHKLQEFEEKFSKFNDCKYLEIGCQNDLCFNSIITNNKIGVDPNAGGTIKTTSDDFFNNNEDFYDVIFIDGLHEYDQCRKDIFEQEVHIAFFNLLDAILNQVQFEISQRKKEKLWSNEL